MNVKELTYQDIVKLRKQMQENNRNFYEQPIVITYQQSIQIENECLALEQKIEKLKKIIKENFCYSPNALYDKVFFKWTGPVMEDEIIEVLDEWNGIEISKCYKTF